MTGDEADTVLALLCAGFPSVELPQPTVELWARKLEARNFEATLAAAESWIDTRSKFPSLAEFMETVDAVLRVGLEERRRSVRALGVSGTQRAVPAEHLHLWRAVMGQPPVRGCGCESCSSIVGKEP